MSKCVARSCRNEGWAAEPVMGVTFCFKHWSKTLSAIAKENTRLDTTRLYRGLGNREEKVYFLKANGFYKIGWSNSPIDRTRAIRSGSDQSFIPELVNRHEVECVGFIPGSRSLEMELHERFEPYRVKGEWFIAAPEVDDEIKNLIREAA